MKRKRSKITVVITRVFEAEFEDTAAESDMLRTLENDRHIGIMNSTSGEGWRVAHAVTGWKVASEESPT